eukprot:UN4623
MALKRVTDTQPLLQIISVCRRAWRFVMQPLVKTWVEQLLVQILVVVAIIQMKTLKTEVEKGSM